MINYKLSHLKKLEAESIYILREIYTCFKKPVFLYSVSKDTAVLTRLIQKAFYPGTFPFPLVFIETGQELPEITEYRTECLKDIDTAQIFKGNIDNFKEKQKHRFKMDKKCFCEEFKHNEIQKVRKTLEFDAFINGVHGDERGYNSKCIYTFNSIQNISNLKIGDPEFWNLYNTNLSDEGIAVISPLSNWAELDIWNYVKEENLTVLPLYYARKREILSYNGKLYPVHLLNLTASENINKAEMKKELLMCRILHIGCNYCNSFIKSEAENLDMVIKETIDKGF
jgi:sulfate adenylyltransferase subunit 2